MAAGQPAREEYREALRTRPEYLVTCEEPWPAAEPDLYGVSSSWHDSAADRGFAGRDTWRLRPGQKATPTLGLIAYLQASLRRIGS